MWHWIDTKPSPGTEMTQRCISCVQHHWSNALEFETHVTEFNGFVGKNISDAAVAELLDVSHKLTLGIVAGRKSYRLFALFFLSFQLTPPLAHLPQVTSWRGWRWWWRSWWFRSRADIPDVKPELLSTPRWRDEEQILCRNKGQTNALFNTIRWTLLEIIGC